MTRSAGRSSPSQDCQEATARASSGKAVTRTVTIRSRVSSSNGWMSAGPGTGHAASDIPASSCSLSGHSIGRAKETLAGGVRRTRTTQGYRAVATQLEREIDRADARLVGELGDYLADDAVYVRLVVSEVREHRTQGGVRHFQLRGRQIQPEGRLVGRDEVAGLGCHV